MSDRDTDYSEKRSETRFPINSVINMTLEGNQVISGSCCNISGSGMLITTDSDTKVAVGDKLSLSISEGKIDFNANADVVRIIEDKDGSQLIAIKVDKQLD